MHIAIRLWILDRLCVDLLFTISSSIPCSGPSVVLGRSFGRHSIAGREAFPFLASSVANLRDLGGREVFKHAADRRKATGTHTPQTPEFQHRVEPLHATFGLQAQNRTKALV